MRLRKREAGLDENLDRDLSRLSTRASTRASQCGNYARMPHFRTMYKADRGPSAFGSQTLHGDVGQRTSYALRLPHGSHVVHFVPVGTSLAYIS